MYCGKFLKLYADETKKPVDLKGQSAKMTVINYS